MVLTNEQVIQVFGDYTPHLKEDGMVRSSWQEAILATVLLPAPLPLAWDRSLVVRRFRCHYKLCARFEAAFNRCFEDPEAWATINDFGGCYAWRPNRNNPKALSRHCWGIAVDIDVADNPNRAKPEMDWRVVQAFEAEGFVWGGRFHVPDSMHFEFVDLTRL